MSAAENPFEILTTAELMATPPRSELVHRTPDSYRLDTGIGPPYEVDRACCRHALELVDWIAHVSRKSWCTAEHIRQLCDLAEADGVWRRA